MKTRPKFRIVEQWGEVHLQQQKSFLGFKWWSYIKWQHSNVVSYPVDFKTWEAAKLEIERRINLHILLYEKAPVITYFTSYPSAAAPQA